MDYQPWLLSPYNVVNVKQTPNCPAINQTLSTLNNTIMWSQSNLQPKSDKHLGLCLISPQNQTGIQALIARVIVSCENKII